MQFFIYYVFWPFVLGAGFIYLSIMGMDPWSFLIIWMLPWLTWPVGKYRRRMMTAAVNELAAEAEAAGEVPGLKTLALTIGPILIMFLSSQAGVMFAPIYMEAVGIDVPAQLERLQQETEARNNAQSH